MKKALTTTLLCCLMVTPTLSNAMRPVAKQHLKECIKNLFTDFNTFATTCEYWTL